MCATILVKILLVVFVFKIIHAYDYNTFSTVSSDEAADDARLDTVSTSSS